MEFEKIYEDTPDVQKLKFLHALIARNKQLQQEFLNYSESETRDDGGKDSLLFIKNISEIQALYQQELEAVDLENPDWDNYHKPHEGYIEEWEQYQQASEQEFNRIFENFKSRAIDALIEQDIDLFLAMIVGLYEACLSADIQDEYESFGEVNQYLAEEHTHIMAELIDKFNISAVSNNRLHQTIHLFFDFCDEEYPGNTSIPNYFEPLIIAMAALSNQPGLIQSSLDASKIEKKAMPQLVLLLHGKTGNDKEWLQNARLYYLSDKGVAKQLLAYYSKHDEPAFIKTANELFTIDKPYWAGMLGDFPEVEHDETLFFDVFFQLTITKKEMKYYEKISKKLDSDTFRELLHSIEPDKLFMVKILEKEKHYDQIRQIVEESNGYWHYPELITPILNIYPDFCFHHIKEKILSTLETSRGRTQYELIAVWLKLAKKISGYHNPTQELIGQLYNHKPSLPALKDELRKGGLV